MGSGVMERFQAENEQDLNKLFREQVELWANGTVFCSHKEAAQLVRGSAEGEDIRWVKTEGTRWKKPQQSGNVGLETRSL